MIANIIFNVETNEEKKLVFGSQQYIDYLALLYHREIAKRLRKEPEAVLNQARDNLRRWLKIHEGTNTVRALEEWQELIDALSVSELIAVIIEDSDEGQRLRSSTPFVGILSDSERKEIRIRCEENLLA